MATAQAAENHGHKASRYTFDEEYIHQIQPGSTQKIQYQQKRHQVHRYPPTKYLFNDHKTAPINTRIIISCAMIRGIHF